MKIGIIRLSALGDIIVSAVFLQHLKFLFPSIEIHWFVDERFGDILENSLFIDKLHRLPFKDIFKSMNPYRIYKLSKTLSNCAKFDIVIDMQGLIKSALIGYMLKKDKFVGFDKDSIREKIASLFYNQKIYIPYERNVLERNKALFCGAFGKEIDIDTALGMRRKVFGYSAKAWEKIDFVIPSNGEKILLFVLEASIQSKTYSADKYIELANNLIGLNVKIFLLWHNNLKKAQKIFDAIKNIHNALILPRLNLDELKALMSKVDIVVGGDTGITHLGWAMQRGSITLYGNTPIERFRLCGEKNISLNGSLNPKYDKNDFSIDKIPPKTIADEIRKIL
ncbi:lipopolysaccharide heptosyltransferase I [Helicobacter sp. 13S00477-4]|uniref:lipopolysaccharide heptosyltransferase I n=1 Tax=Helicobacter sp. 13S00477-4 TaxID=1905759 RepID=UPI000BA60113|nr:lipopolysaccharide heptosyltransferase I [Helicobacter sp. 13S00477-4]PAF50502.1 lipopolysaccharide heptosyltransferase I [Helicobacter sp. 13S00477-4]